MTAALEIPRHDRLRSRTTLEATLVCTSAIHVGAGKVDESRSLTDMPVARNGRGEPYVPGSSFRGSLRSGLEALLRGLGRPVCNPLQRDATAPDASCSVRIAEDRKKEKEAITETKAFDLARTHCCDVCSVFGHSFLASRLWIPDLALDGMHKTYSRDGVGIDRDLRTAARGILYNFEALAAGARFRLRLEIDNAADAEIGLLLVGLDLFEQGFLTLGGKRARGLGGAKVEALSLHRHEAKDYFANSAGRDLTEETKAFREAARAHYLGEES